MKTSYSTAAHKPETLIIGVQSPYNPLKSIESYYEEFRNLVHSSGRDYEHEMYVKLRSLDPTHYFTAGKLEEIVAFCAEKNIEEVVVSEPLSTGQERTLTKLLNCTVIDRTHVILDIFERGAHSSEGKKQIALARFQYEKSRLAGRGISMSQQSGKRGTRGPGETQKEKDTRHLERMMSKLQRDLEHLAYVRETQRKQRVKGDMPLICLIGYTNAGKSTVLNALTKSEVLAENKLFSTLDTTTRALFIDGKKKALISDTVGFIQQLPHNLIEAFKSTLDELQYAHLLLQVVDVSDPNWQEHCTVVQNVLHELGVIKPMLFVFNKSDRIDNIKALEGALSRYEPHVIVSAVTPGGLDPLVSFLRTWQPEKA